MSLSDWMQPGPWIRHYNELAELDRHLLLLKPVRRLAPTEQREGLRNRRMLFLKAPQSADDIRSFCAHFEEGMRVEYKGTFDQSVRNQFPKIVSSFANSLGGVLIIGVHTNNGVPQEPIEGFELPPREELPLTIENICLQGIHPPVFPRTRIVRSDVEGRGFLVVEVDESWEAPHGVENSKRVFVRTGNATNPHELADVDLLIELIRRREEPAKFREALAARGHRRASSHVGDNTVHLDLVVGPHFPRRPLCTVDETWAFLWQSVGRGAFYPLESLRRIENGSAAFADGAYAEISKFGLFVGRQSVRIVRRELFEMVDCLTFFDVLEATLKALRLSGAFYQAVGWRGNAEVEMRLENVLGRTMPFFTLDQLWDGVARDFTCHDQSVSASHVFAAENMLLQTGDLLREMLTQICWPFWQSPAEFPTRGLHEYIHENLPEMGEI